jgi:hypothetical protein
VVNYSLTHTPPPAPPSFTLLRYEAVGIASTGCADGEVSIYGASHTRRWMRHNVVPGRTIKSSDTRFKIYAPTLRKIVDATHGKVRVHLYTASSDAGGGEGGYMGHHRDNQCGVKNYQRGMCKYSWCFLAGAGAGAGAGGSGGSGSSGGYATGGDMGGVVGGRGGAD